MHERYELQGVVERSLFQGSDNGYSVIIMQVEGKQVTLTGFLASVQPGQQLVVHGAWSTHPKFGRQFQVSTFEVTLPTSVHGLIKYLSSGLIKGIGKVYAQKLVDRFGTQVLEIIEDRPDRLHEVPGIGPKRIEQIARAWQDQKEISSIMVFLQDKGVSTAYAIKIFKKYGKESIARVQENPYRLADDIWGIGFKSADKIAQALGFETHSVKRVRAGILFAIAQQTNQGHLYVELANLKTQTIALLELEEERAASLLKIAFHELYDQDRIKLIVQQPADEPVYYVTLTQYYLSEKAIAASIRRLLEQETPHGFDLEKIYTTLRSSQNNTEVFLNDDQQQGIMTCLQKKVTIITGGPGTGKTTLIKKLLEILTSYKLTYRLAAPTGRAAKRITEGTGENALTLHRLLEFDVSTMSFSHNEHNALKLDFLIVDEASMIDVFLARSLLRALPYNAHLVLLGDVDQLPSVGAGNFLNDIIASTIVPCIRLHQIFRQAKDSLIIINAHRVNQGEFPLSFLPHAHKDFYFIKEEDPLKAFEHIKAVFSKGLAIRQIHPQEAVVLVPMNRGVVGTLQLNHELQNFLNATSELTLSHGATVFRLGDKVIQLTNNYDKNIFNGDVGFIQNIDISQRTLQVQFDRIVEYEYDELNELMLAYALSIHKSQGSEYSAVIVPIFMQHFMLLQRNLIYTALTRAKKLCIFIGQPKALALAIKNNKTIERITFLKDMLISDLICR